MFQSLDKPFRKLTLTEMMIKQFQKTISKLLKRRLEKYFQRFFSQPQEISFG